MFKVWVAWDVYELEYELYDLYGDVFRGSRVWLGGSGVGDGECREVDWKEGFPAREYGGGGNGTDKGTCGPWVDLVLEVCKGEE